MSRKTALFTGDAGAGSRRSRIDSDMELDITPMIDVTFLLLIFFMVASTMQATPDIQVPAANHGVGVQRGDSLIVVVRKSPDGGPYILKIEKGRDLTLDELRQAVEESIQQNRSHVVIKAEGTVPYGDVTEVTRIVNEVKGATFSYGVRDKMEYSR